MHEHDTVCPSVMQGHFEYPPQWVAVTADWNRSRVRYLLIKSGRPTVLHEVAYLWNNVRDYYGGRWENMFLVHGMIEGNRRMKSHVRYIVLQSFPNIFDTFILVHL